MAETISGQSSTPRAPIARYTRVAMILHWLVASLLVIGVVAGLAAEAADDANVRRLVDFHKSIGLTALAFVILRILWRIAHKPPPMPASYSRTERIGAHAAHFALYAVMLMIPVTGYIHDSAWRGAPTHPIKLYDLVPFPRIGFIESMAPAAKEQIHSIFFGAHVWLGYALYALVFLHIAGAIKHQVFDQEREFQRMLPAGYQRPEEADGA